MMPSFEEAIRVHDRAVANAGVELWVGSEPTYTDRFSESQEWLNGALGQDKQLRACQMLRALQRVRRGSVVLRSLGRQYEGEDLPRWSYGLYERRDEALCWAGPPDPLTIDSCPSLVDSAMLRHLWRRLADKLTTLPWSVACFQLNQHDFGLRIIARTDNQPIPASVHLDPRLSRPSIHSHPIPLEGARDDLAAEGYFLTLIGTYSVDHDGESASYACVELPAFSEPTVFVQLLDALGRAANDVGLDHLILSGFPPPVDASVAWTTVTPDPAVVEINMAPFADVMSFYRRICELFTVASELGLSAKRMYYNGHSVDSGGGGHVTLGGQSAAQSLFMRNAKLLPRLIAYFNQHPSLSYLFATEKVGSSGQSPRPDEGLHDAFQELRLAIDTLARQDVSDVKLVWQTLAPFLTDHTGNTHRTEINIEKFYNPYLPGRGLLGLIEFRAFRMAPTPEWSASVVALLRAITTMLHVGDWPLRLTDWGENLHDRFALPFFLACDLRVVFNDLSRADLGLETPIVAQLEDDAHRLLGCITIDGYRITIKHAIQFWPIVGNVTAQEGGASRFIDASTVRLEVTIRPVDVSKDELSQWQLCVGKYRLAMRIDRDEQGPVVVLGIRYRDFFPQLGLHPSLRAQNPLALTFVNEALNRAVSVTLHDWRPNNTAYAGLPLDERDAQQRCAERFVVDIAEFDPSHITTPVPSDAVTAYSVDLRYLQDS